MMGGKSQKRRTLSHKKKVSALCLSVDGQYLITGDKQGLIYVWNAHSASIQTNQIDPKENGLVSTFEIHKDKGQINNLIPIRRPLSLFGLTANMKAYEVNEVKPLQKNLAAAKPMDEVLELGFGLSGFQNAQANDESNYLFEEEEIQWIMGSAQRMLGNSAESAQKSSPQKASNSMSEMQQLKEENNRLKRTL